MAVGGGLIVVTDRWLQFKFRGKWDEWILHVHCRANMIFAFCLESCLDTSLPLVIRQRKLSSICKRYLLKIQNTCAYRSSNIYICAGQTQQKCVSLECGQSAPTQGRLWNRFIILIKSSNTLYWQYIHFHVINFLSYIIWYHRWWFPGIITIIISYHILCTYYISIIILCLCYIIKLLISSSLIYPQWRGNCVTWSGADWDCFCNQPPSCGGAGRALQDYHHYDHFPHPFFTTMIMIVNNKFFPKRTLSVAWSSRTSGKHERGTSSFFQLEFTGLADCMFLYKIASGISDGHIFNDSPHPRPLKAEESSSTQTRVVHPSGRVLQE